MSRSSATSTRSLQLSLPIPEPPLPFASGLPFDPPPPDAAAVPATPQGYADYLRSPRWLALRAEALERDGHRCRYCNSPDRIGVHHRRYPAVLGTETVDDLTTTCSGCHLVLSWFRTPDGGRRMRSIRRGANGAVPKRVPRW